MFKIKRKGFTLFELLIAVVIICLGTISIVLFSNNLQNNQNEKYKELVQEIIKVTKVYVETNDNRVSALNEKGSLIVKIGELQEAGLLKWNLENPKTQEKISSDSYVTVTKGSNSRINYEYNQK